MPTIITPTLKLPTQEGLAELRGIIDRNIAQARPLNVQHEVFREMPWLIDSTIQAVQESKEDLQLHLDLYPNVETDLIRANDRARLQQELVNAKYLLFKQIIQGGLCLYAGRRAFDILYSRNELLLYRADNDEYHGSLLAVYFEEWYGHSIVLINPTKRVDKQLLAKLFEEADVLVNATRIFLEQHRLAQHTLPHILAYIHDYFPQMDTVKALQKLQAIGVDEHSYNAHLKFYPGQMPRVPVICRGEIFDLFDLLRFRIQPIARNGIKAHYRCNFQPYTGASIEIDLREVQFDYLFASELRNILQKKPRGRYARAYLESCLRANAPMLNMYLFCLEFLLVSELSLYVFGVQNNPETDLSFYCAKIYVANNFSLVVLFVPGIMSLCNRLPFQVWPFLGYNRTTLDTEFLHHLETFRRLCAALAGGLLMYFFFGNGMQVPAGIYMCIEPPEFLTHVDAKNRLLWAYPLMYGIYILCAAAATPGADVTDITRNPKSNYFYPNSRFYANMLEDKRRHQSRVLTICFDKMAREERRDFREICHIENPHTPGLLLDKIMDYAVGERPPKLEI